MAPDWIEVQMENSEMPESSSLGNCKNPGPTKRNQSDQSKNRCKRVRG